MHLTLSELFRSELITDMSSYDFSRVLEYMNLAINSVFEVSALRLWRLFYYSSNVYYCYDITSLNGIIDLWEKLVSIKTFRFFDCKLIMSRFRGTMRLTSVIQTHILDLC